MRTFDVLALTGMSLSPSSALIPDPVATGSGALYAFLTAVAVAALALIGQLIQSRNKTSPTSRTAKRAAAHYEACKLFITLNTDADVRKIKDGYESMDEVRRA